MMKILDSIISRYRLFKASYFSFFPEGRRLKKLKDIHRCQRCFIIGNGPSLRSEDLTKIKNNNDITFAFNRIFHIFSDTTWRPTYYLSQDERMLLGCEDEVEKIPADIKFIPIENRWYYGIKKLKGIQYFHLISENETNFFSENINKYIVARGTVVYTAIQVAVYMGIKEIYLIGVDHQFNKVLDKDGKLVIDNTVQNYFCNAYDQDKDNLWIPNTDKTTLIYMSAKEYADAHGIKIYNATRGGKLEVFPRVEFDSLF